MNTTPLLEMLSHTAMKGAAVLLVALLLGLILRKTAASRRYAIWITAIAALAVLPLAMWALPVWRVLPKADEMNLPAMEPPHFSVNAGEALPAEISEAIQPAAVSVPYMQAPAPAAFSWSISWQDVVEVLPMAWMLTAALLLQRLGLSAWRLQRLEASLQPGECPALDQAAHELGLRRTPCLLIGPADSVPMVWGVFRPRLLLPQGFENWPQEKLRGVLLHELAHLKRGDPLALWLAQWVKALHWFNPLAWLTLRQLRADQERACDDAVLRQGVRASDYAQSLLDLSRHNRLARGLSLCALTITRFAPVEARVQAILDPARRRDGLTLRWLAGLAGGALLITLPVAMLHAIEGHVLRGRILDRNGIVLAESTKEKARSYPLKTLTAHVVGYTGKTGREDVTLTGRFALEKQHDAVLRKGKDLSLTLDARVQSLATRALNENIQRGAIVIMDPESGDILAYVSVPSYDPNRFIPTLNAADWENYTRDKDLPLFDRVSTSRSAPGAIFQPMTALAAFVSGKNPGTYECAPLAREAGGGVRFGSTTKICRISLLDGAAHGPLTLEQALSKCCSSYFFQLGAEVGYPALLTTAGHLGLQRDADIFGAKSVPVMPTQEKLAKTHSSPRQLTDITTAFASGNGSAVSVLQMAVLYSALANGKVWDTNLIRNDAGQPRLDLNSLPGLPEGLARVRSALLNAVNDPRGRAHAAASAKVTIAALSDTHVTGRKGPHSEVFTHHHWVGGYVPAGKPALAFALYMDETSANRSADPARLGPIIRRIVEETLALPADGSGEVKPVEEKGVVMQAAASSKIVPKPPQITKTTSARVISRSPGASSGSILVIDKGSLDGIVAESPVITLEGLVGKTATPEAHATKVMLLTDKLCLVSAKVVGGIEKGILNGEGASHEAPPQLHLRFLSRDSKIGTGSKVYSSGEGGVFPADLLLGHVKFFKQGDFSGEAIVEPVVDFAHLEQVFVIETRPVPPEPETAPPAKSAGQAQTRQRADSEIVMKLELANQWSALKRAGLLADLPVPSQLLGPDDKHPERQMQSVLEFHFVAPRDAVRRWLVDSHCTLRTVEKRGAMGFVQTSHTLDEPSALEWPARPEVFTRTYAAAGQCTITVQSTENDDVHVKISHAKPSILIAPEESREPQPKGRLAPDYHGKGFTQVDSMPALDSALQSLRPAISADERDSMPAVRVQSVVKVKAFKPATLPVALPFPLERFQGELSEESQKVIARSYLEEQGRMYLQSRRMQQALIVQPPKA